MPTDKDFKRLVRARMGRTGESYTTARSHLRPGDPGDPGADPGGYDRLRGRHPDTAAVARLLAAVGVTHPQGGRPLGEAMVLGVGGGIGVAYFVFEYEALTTLYLGGRINPFVLRQDPAEAVLARLGVPAQVRRTTSPAAAERQLRAALDQGRPVVVTVDAAALGHGAVPAELRGMTPQDVLVELRDGAPVLWDLAPAPVPVGWAELAEARAGVRSAKHRLVAAEAPGGPVDLAGAAAAGIADTWRGMLDPPRRNFGVPALAKWAELLTAARDPKGWPRLLAAPGRQFQLLTWLYDWVETAGTGGGFFRALYAEFLEEAAGPLGRPGLAGLAGDYRKLAAAWTALAKTAVAAAGDGPLARAAALLATRRRLVEERGADPAAELAAVQAELAALARAAADPQPLDPATLSALLADLRDRVLVLAAAEEAAAAALRAAVPAPAGSWQTPPQPDAQGASMTALPRNITFDCANPYLLVGFWRQVTGYRDDPENPNQPGDPEGYLAGPEGQPGLLFVIVPEHKTVKNRVHLDLMPTDRTRDEEVERLLGIGANLVADRRRPDGTGWVVLADPEGNEFCVERSAAERAATG